jgi:hypothetical protein
MGFAYSWNGLSAAGTWGGVPWVAWAAPLAIDGFIIVATLAAVYKRSVGDSTVWAWSAVGIYTGISVVLNAMHALIEGQPEYEALRVAVGMFVAGLMPLSIWFATHLAVSILVPKPEVSRQEVKAQIHREHEAERAEAQRRQNEERLRIEQDRAAADRQRARVAEQQEWERIRDSKEARTNGTPERDYFITKVLETFERAGGRVSARTAKILGVSENRVRSVVGEYEWEDTSR